jgi:hypothetical protein
VVAEHLTQDQVVEGLDAETEASDTCAQQVCIASGVEVFGIGLKRYLGVSREGVTTPYLGDETGEL